ncbi:hypothetical protein ACHRV1_07960 [Flavobacterium aquidurense]|uniref:hypothetical protein n=1 Tax=Flavobacterium aquidurense TaxID=362413 RepID=UPI0037576C85
MNINDDEIPNIFQLKETFIKDSFWFLNWIDGVYVVDDIKYVDFHFINKDTPDDKFSEFQKNCQVTVQLKFSLTSFFSIGCVFDEYGRLLYFPEGINYDCDLIDINKDYALRLVKGKIQCINENLVYPFPSDELTNELEYFTTNINVNGSTIKIIIPVLAMCSYLYFKSEDLTEYIISNEWSSVFSFREVERDNIKTGYFEYDNSKILNSEIKSISQFFFLKDSLGLKSIILIGNHLRMSLIKNKLKEGKKSVYLSTVIPFSYGANFKLRGKIINHEGQIHFFTYAIEDITVENNLFTVDRVILVPRFPNIQHLEDKIKHLREVRKRQNRKRFEGYKGLRDVKNYNGTYFPTDFFLKKSPLFFNLSIITQMSDEELITIHQNLYSNRNKANTYKSDYIFLICKELIHKLKSPYINFIAIDQLLFDRKETVIVVNDLKFNVLIVEISYQNNYFYLIDFLRDYFGLVSSEKQNSKITPLTLKIFLHKIIYEYFRLPDFLLWYALKKDRAFFIENFGIDVLDYLGYNPMNIYCNDNEVDKKVADIKKLLKKYRKNVA